MPAATDAPQVEALDVIVEALTELEADPSHGPRAFYDRLCAALCGLTTMERAGLLLYDEVRRLVVPAGSHGVPATLLDGVYGTLDETPVAQVALSEDRVVVLSGGLAGHVPARYAQLDGIETLTCTPVAAGGRWLGVIFADRGGASFELRGAERHTMWVVGRAAALAASARIATDIAAQARLLNARIELARDLHERVVQRLVGVSLALGSEADLDGALRARCGSELGRALEDLRLALARPLAPPSRAIGEPALRAQLDRLASSSQEPPLQLRWAARVDLPPAVERLVLSVLTEALHNARKHARPSEVTVSAGETGAALELVVENDGVSGRAVASGGGLGLRLARYEALEQGGMVEYGREGDDRWRVRLVIALA